MEEKPKSEKTGSVEASLVGTLLEFHQRVISLVRESALDASGKMNVYERIHSLMDQLNDEFKNDVVDPRNFDLAGRLEAIYNEAARIIDDSAGDERASDQAP